MHLSENNEILQESPKKGYSPQVGSYLSASLPGFVKDPWRGLQPTAFLIIDLLPLTEGAFR